MSVQSFANHALVATRGAAIQGSMGVVIGSIAGYLATAWKISSRITFVNFGVAMAAGLGTHYLLNYIANKASLNKPHTLTKTIISDLAIPVISSLAAIYAAYHATMAVYTIVALGALLILASGLLQNVAN